MSAPSGRAWLRPRNVALGLLAMGVVSYAMDHNDTGASPIFQQGDQGFPADEAPIVSGNPARHQDPRGFELDRPERWEIEALSLGEISVRAPGGETGVLIRARAVQGDLSRWLAEAYPATERTLAGGTLVEGRAQGGDVARATYRVRAGNRLATAVAVRRGGVATIFVAYAPADRYPEELPRLTSILESFRFTNRGDRPVARPAARFVRWVEPHEQAFSMEIPEGWRPEGGLLRRADGVRVAAQMTSPDGAAFMFFGDGSVPSYFVYPSQVALSLGSREGYPTGPNGPIMLRFLEAEVMGRRILEQRFGSVEVVTAHQRPDLIETLRRNPALQGGPSQLSAAELEFRLADGRLGILALSTQGQPVQDLGGTWRVDHIHGFVAPPERAGETGMALARAVGTSRESPAWRVGEAAHQGRMSAQYQEYVAYSSNLQRQTLEARWASDVARQAGRRDILGGTVRLQDPVSGERFETGGQDRYYYRVMDGRGNTGIGTDTDFSPAPELDLRRMLQVGVDVP